MKNQRKQGTAEKLLIFLQWIEEQTLQNKLISGSLAQHMKTFEVSYYNEVGIILREEGIVATVNSATGLKKKGSTHKYVSTIKPNIKMSEATMDAAVKYAAERKQQSAAANLTTEKHKTGIEQARAAGVIFFR